MRPILIVESDHTVQQELELLFGSEGYDVEIQANGRSALNCYRASLPTAVILALKLPDMPGVEVCREIKKNAPGLPVVVLSVISDVACKVQLLETGADDYVTKPFNPKELLARVRVAIRRSQNRWSGDLITFDGISVDFAGMTAYRDKVPLALTSQEFKVLAFFARNPERVVSRRELLQLLGYENCPETRAIDNCIFRLRHKLEKDHTNPTHLCTVRGSGYRFVYR